MVVFMALTIMILAPITGIGGVIMAVREDVPLSGLLVVILPLMFVVIALVMRRAIPLFRAMQAKLDRINQVMREALSGVRVIRAFVRTHHEEARFEVANQDLFDTSIRVNRLFAVTIPTMMAILNLSTVAVMWFGSLRIDSGGMPIGNLTAFMAYLMQILMAVLMAIFMFILVPRAAVSSDRIQEVLTTEPSIHDPVTPLVMPAILPAHRNGTGNGHGPSDGDGPGACRPGRWSSRAPCPPRPRAPSSSATWSSGTQVRSSPSCTTSPSPPDPARRRPSWARREAARRRSSTSSRACTT